MGAIVLTSIAVWSGFDWSYFTDTRSDLLRSIAFPAVTLGALLPILLPLVLIGIGAVIKNKKTILCGWAIGQAAFIGWFISSLYKAFTGRVGPYLYGTGPDISAHFQFGFLRGGIFWGWPSSHTAVAFAMAVTLFILFRHKHVLCRIATLIYAIYIGLAVSVTIHWFSDFLAGAIIGTIIGIIVGKTFLKEFVEKS